MKKIISTLLSLAIVIGMCPIIQVSAEVVLSGEGTAERPYQITSKAELIAARDMINADTAGTGARKAYYELTTDIDLAGEEWMPIAPVNAFLGSFDGKNHVISNVSVELTNDNASEYGGKPALGFFGKIQGQSGTDTSIGTVKNLGLDTVSVKNNYTKYDYPPHSMGGFAGYITYNAAISNCFVRYVTIEQNKTDQRPAYGVGGFYGGCGNQTPTFVNCYVYTAFLQSKCKSDSERDIIGGFVGLSTPKASYTNCYTAKITTNDDTTALTSFYAFGRTKATSSTIANCYAENVDIQCLEGKGVYNADQSMGKTNTSKADLVTKMTKFEAFGTLSTINDGYPCLIYEDESLIPTPAPTFNPVDIKDISGGIKYFEQNFDDATIAEGDRVTTDMGFSQVLDTGSNKNARYYVGHDDITDVSETSNRVMQVVPKIVQARATEEQYAQLQASETSVQWGTNTYKVIDFVDGYYIASKCTTRNTSLYWIKKSSVVDGVLTSTVSDTDYGTTFYTDEDGTITNVSPGVTGILVYFDEPNDDAGKYAIQFDYAYPDNGNMRTGQEGFNLGIDNGEYHIREYGLFRGYGYTKRYLDFGENEASLEAEAKNTYVAKVDADADIPHYFLSTDDYTSQIDNLSTRVDLKWYKVMVYVDRDNKYYTIYLDGYPLYFKAENGGYSCRMKFSGDTLDPIKLSTNRLCIFNDHAPVFDNFLGYYSTGSDEETVKRVLDKIEMPYIDAPVITNDILFDENESALVEWSFSNDTFVIDEENPLIARYNAPFGNGTSKVTLIATCNYGTATGTKTFELTVKDRQKYECDTVLMKDSSGNRIYRPLDNSVIESVSYTANSDETATMYLAIYDAEDRLVTCKTATAADGKCTFNQPINANQTYKVFLWENGTVTPLAIPETGEYPESDAPKIFVIGDSIAATYSASSTLRGWGQYLDTAFDGVVVDNTRAIGGRTTKYALAEDSLKYVLDNSQAGDYLFVMLAHNDEKYKTDYYGATPEEYKMLLVQMIDSSRAKGVTPVLITSLARPQYTNGVLVDSHKEYREAMFEVSEATGIPIIDVDTMSRDVLDDYTYSTYQQLGYFSTDTHTIEKGAKWVVSLIAGELKKMNLPISEFLK